MNMIEVTLVTFISRRCIKCRAKDELVHKIDASNVWCCGGRK